LHPGLKTVIELQQLDTEIAEYSAQIDLLPKEIQAIETQLNEFIHAHEERKLRLSKNLKERKDLEAEIQSIRTKISKHKDQLYEVKTNEQYKAMQKEIEGEEARVRGFEDQILEKMVEAEDLEEHIRDAAARLDSEKARVAAEVRKLQTLRQADEEKRDELRARRNTDAASIDTELLAEYERLRRGKRGQAVSRVLNGMCAACNVMLRPQLFNEVRTNEFVMMCEQCGRILYFVEPPPETEDSAGDHSGQTPA
jgi:predicted  nucleic acid-binding Zn-ribbon protein